MKALIDGDILRYELGHSGEYWEKDDKGNFVLDKDGKKVRIIREFDFLENLLEQKLFIIGEMVKSTEPPCLYLTNDARTTEIYNRYAKTNGLDPIEFKPNFRDAIATVKPYKGTRKSEKPVHYDNLTSHIINNYEFKLSNGIEADDQMAIDQTAAKPLTTIICSRDKDLRQVAGMHYSWECGNQREIGPLEFDKKGYIKDKNNNKVFGGGERFFLYQLLVGDAVDNIPGCPKVGHVKAMKLLQTLPSRKECYEAVRGCYSNVYGEDDITHLNEQGRLLWLKRHKDDEWSYPYA